MGAGNNHWPTDISDEDMGSAVQHEGWPTKPFKAPTGLGIGIKMACPCGCHSVGIYHLIERDMLEIDGNWYPRVTFKYGPGSLPDPGPALSARLKRIRVWNLVRVQSAYGPSGRSHRELANRMAAMIPGIGDRVPSPCNCEPFKRAIWGMIQHLNDAHHPAHGDDKGDDLWSRERIADWLETLDADLVLDPDHKAPPPVGPSYQEQVEMIEKISLDVSTTVFPPKATVDEFIKSMSKLAEAIFIPKPMLKVKDMHALSSAFLSGGEEGMAKVMAEKGITTMQVEEAFMQPHSVEKHEPCLCFICKIQKKKTNQEES